MPRFFVNLPVEYTHGPRAFLDLFLEQSIHPEIGLDGVDFSCSETRKRLTDLASLVRDHGLSCTVHLPFARFEDGYASGPNAAWAIREMKRAMEAASLFRPRRLVAHPYLHRIAAQHGTDKEAGLEQAALFWNSALDSLPDGPALCLENIFELSPQTHLRLLEIMDNPRAGICFDVGHWHAFSRGCEHQDLEQWVQAFGDRIYHVHLHDNDGSGDQHLGLGRGTIPWDRFFTALGSVISDSAPTVTLEPHTAEDFQASLKFFAGHPDLPV